jgi:hypothetical protein
MLASVTLQHLYGIRPQQDSDGAKGTIPRQSLRTTWRRSEHRVQQNHSVAAQRERVRA